jgi:hypothetical protein
VRLNPERLRFPVRRQRPYPFACHLRPAVSLQTPGSNQPVALLVGFGLDFGGPILSVLSTPSVVAVHSGMVKAKSCQRNGFLNVRPEVAASTFGGRGNSQLLVALFDDLDEVVRRCRRQSAPRLVELPMAGEIRMRPAGHDRPRPRGRIEPEQPSVRCGQCQARQDPSKSQSRQAGTGVPLLVQYSHDLRHP